MLVVLRKLFKGHESLYSRVSKHEVVIPNLIKIVSIRMTSVQLATA